MSFVRVPVLIGEDENSLREVTFLVDTGSFFTMLPPSLAQELGILTTINAPVVVADNRMVHVDLGLAYVRIMDRESGVPIGLMNVPEPLLGVTALEALGLKVNPIEETLEHARPYGPAILGVFDWSAR